MCPRALLIVAAAAPDLARLEPNVLRTSWSVMFSLIPANFRYFRQGLSGFTTCPCRAVFDGQTQGDPERTLRTSFKHRDCNSCKWHG